MDDKLKVFWNLDVLVKMSRSKSDGPSLRIEENEIEEKITTYMQEIEDIKSSSEEEIYDTSAEMADRNIEIITKKQLQKLKSDLKDKNKELNKLKEEESRLYEQTSLLRDNKSSQEKYIVSMQDRISGSTDDEIIDRYNSLIAETSEKVALLKQEIVEQNFSYNDVQQNLVQLSEDIADIEEKIDKKKKLLAETQANLENKDNYIDKTKKEKNARRIEDLENKIQKLNSRLETLRNDSKYLESKVKDVINNHENIENAKEYLINLINQVIKVPYINVPTDNMLEEELLRATQARDSFANEIDQKSYNILEANTPEKIRIEFLTDRINRWQDELTELKGKINLIDKDQQFDYERRSTILTNMLRVMKNDLNEYEKAYADIPDTNIGAKASLKAALDEKKEDVIEAEKIATAFKKDEADDISNATRMLKYECEQLNNKIYNADTEISNIKNRLMSKKSGMIDITSRNKDKEILKELAQIVIDIKHRRQFPETPIDIVNRLEEELKINLSDNINLELINETSTLEPRDYEEYIKPVNYEETEQSEEDSSVQSEDMQPNEEEQAEYVQEEYQTDEDTDASQALQNAIDEVTNFEDNQKQRELEITNQSDQYQDENYDEQYIDMNNYEVDDDTNSEDSADGTSIMPSEETDYQEYYDDTVDNSENNGMEYEETYVNPEYQEEYQNSEYPEDYQEYQDSDNQENYQTEYQEPEYQEEIPTEYVNDYQNSDYQELTNQDEYQEVDNQDNYQEPIYQEEVDNNLATEEYQEPAQIENQPAYYDNDLSQPTDTDEINENSVDIDTYRDTNEINYVENQTGEEQQYEPIIQDTEEPLDINSMFNESSEIQPTEYIESVPVEEPIELQPTSPEAYDGELAINTMFNNETVDTSQENSDNIISSTNLANELDKYLDDLDNK